MGERRIQALTPSIWVYRSGTAGDATHVVRGALTHIALRSHCPELSSITWEPAGDAGPQAAPDCGLRMCSLTRSPGTRHPSRASLNLRFTKGKMQSTVSERGASTLYLPRPFFRRQVLAITL